MNGRREKGPRADGLRGRGRPRADPFRFDRRRLAALGGEAHVLAGADEAGRGCLAGPLVAAAVTLDYSRSRFPALEGLTDSKLLARKRREELYHHILAEAGLVSITVVSAHTIDEVGLHRCNLRALGDALAGLGGRYDLALVDGFEVGRPQLRAERLVGGDGKSAVVAAASVVAKVVRDRLMRALDAIHPLYGFAEHVGYGTRQHREALRVHGPCVLHRRSFAGVGESHPTLWSDGDLDGDPGAGE